MNGFVYSIEVKMAWNTQFQLVRSDIPKDELDAEYDKLKEYYKGSGGGWIRISESRVTRLDPIEG